jgi:hypothetical protein
MAVTGHTLPRGPVSGITRFVSLPDLLHALLRRCAVLVMLLATLALAPAAIAGSLEAGADLAKIAAASYAIDADGCVTEASSASADTQPANPEHCPACCLHHHGPIGQMANAHAVDALRLTRSAWHSWEPSGPAETALPRLIRPPRV